MGYCSYFCIGIGRQQATGDKLTATGNRLTATGKPSMTVITPFCQICPSAKKLWRKNYISKPTDAR